MRKRTDIAIWSTVVVASLGLHAVAFGGLGGRRDGFGARKTRPPTLVEMSVSKRPEAPEAPKPEPPRPAARTPKLAVAKPARLKAAPPPPVAPAAPPPAAESPADFTGVTMTNDGPGAGWSSATGNGDAMKGPVGRPGARVTHRSVDGGDADLGRTPGPAVVAAADLSRPPVAPDLTAALARHYPPDARAKGLAGKAVLRVRIQPDGHVGDTRLESETAPGFGAACQATLRGAPWSAPVDRQGRSVATYVKYTCRFEVQ